MKQEPKLTPHQAYGVPEVQRVIPVLVGRICKNWGRLMTQHNIQ